MIFVYNENFEKIHFVESYTSLIWANRYRESGDCEICVPATKEALSIYKIGRFIVRDDDGMICRIEKVEVQTDADEGDLLIVTGYDLKSILDKRIIWGTQYSSATVNTAEKFIRQIIYKSVGQGADADRQIIIGGRPIQLGTLRNFPEEAPGQVSYENVGEYVRAYCEQYNRGYRLLMYQNQFFINLYQGTDRTENVIFSTFLETLNSSSYSDDESIAKNVALIGGEGEGKNRIMQQVGKAKGINRAEIFVDADGNSKSIGYDELKEQYPLETSGGYGYILTQGGKHYYAMRLMTVQLFDKSQYNWLLRNYGYFASTYIDNNGNSFYEIEQKAPNGSAPSEVIIASFPEYVSDAEPGDASLYNIVYYQYLLKDGYTELGENGAEKTFDCTVIPNGMYKYKTDYNVGDKVKVDNGYGIELDADILEAVESEDDNGYNLELTLTAYFPEQAGFVPPNHPVDVTATAGNAFNTIEWSSIAGEGATFEIYRCEGTESSQYIAKIGDADESDYDPSTQTYSFADNYVGSTYTYYYRVLTVESGVKSVFSNQASCIGNPVPLAPTNVAAEALTSNRIKLTWTASIGAQEYNVYRRVGTSGSYEYLNTTANLTYTDSGLTAGTTYYYKISALCTPVYESDQSASVHATAQT